MTIPGGPPREAWFSAVEGGPFTYSENLSDLLDLSPAEREALRAAGDRGRERLLEMIAARVVDSGRYVAEVAEARRSGQAVQLELPLRDGRILEGFSAPLRDAEGRVLGRTVFYRDVTAQRRDEAELRGRARRQEAVARLGRAAIATEAVDPLLAFALSLVAETLDAPRTAFLHLSDDGQLAVRAAFGHAPEVVGSAAADAVRTRLVLSLLALGPLDALGPEALSLSELLGGPPEPGAAVLVRGKDRPWGVLAVHAPRALQQDELVFLDSAAGVLGSALARHQAEAATAESERLARAVFERAHDAMVVADGEGCVLDANPAACRLFGLARDAIVGRGLAERLPPARRREARVGWEKLLAEGEAEGEAEVLGAGGATRAVEYTSVAHIVPGRHLSVLRDVTERRQLRARLALADKMMSVGTMAAGVAHELNNPLAYVSANLGYLSEALEALRRALPEVDAAREAGGEALVPEMVRAATEGLEGAGRMRLIIRDLLALTRSDGTVRGPVDLGPILESCLHIAWNEIRHRARLERALAPVPFVDGNAARLSQVFLNLLVNAAQAVPEGGPARHVIRVATRLHASGRVAVEVSDTGGGIPPEHLPRIFDPFFTTKPVGSGTGLGLSISHHIVASYGGEIEVETEPGRGTTFRVLLQPSSEPAAPPAPAAEVPEPQPPGAVTRLLVIDDEPLVGMALARALGGEHEVEVVESGEAALARLRADPGYDLVLSDLLMPGMTGMDLHARLAAEAPALAGRMLFLTGGAFTPEAAAFVEAHRADCLEKPFDVRALRAEVRRRLLAQASGFRLQASGSRLQAPGKAP
ncbi:MAG TPA: ATP-binding protein [Anaeromyxobacteraceae bacterium]|nr:ATP-binding protein [Anaeromyxobacteraceae bacterium]